MLATLRDAGTDGDFAASHLDNPEDFMPRDERSSVRIQIDDEDESTPGRPLPDTAFCIAVVGDFGGGTGTRRPFGERAPLQFDRDDVDDAVAAVRPALGVPLGGRSETIEFRSMDDFHPDSLYERVSVFATLRDLRRRLADRGTAAEVARTVTSGRAAAPPASAAALTSASGLLDQMLDVAGASEPVAARPAPREDELASFIRRVMAPHLVADEDPQQAELISAAAAAVASQMRELLHDRGFAALETTWRTAAFLARRLETDSRLRLYLVDVSRAELDADLGGDDVRSTRLYQLLGRAAASLPDSSRWSVLCGLHEFDDSAAEQLVMLGRIGRALGAPWICGAAPALVGIDAFDALLDDETRPTPESAAWQSVRRSDAARWVGLAAPRFLLRAPYGEEGDAVESFDFEEDDGVSRTYRWGNSAALCALLLGQAFAEDDWRMRPGSQNEVRGLPLYVYRRDGEAISLPCAETLMTEHAAERMLERGVMPVASLRDSDAVRLLRFQSIAAPLAPLAGPWP